MTTKIYPRSGSAYTLRQIIKDLELRDGPSLGFYVPPVQVPREQWPEGYDALPNFIDVVIQTAHLTEEELLSVPGLADTEWIYQYETDEWCPVFTAVDPSAVVKCVDMEPLKDKYGPPSSIFNWWVIPKGFPREQYDYEEDL